MGMESQQRLLVDSDAYCKLGAAGLLHEAFSAFGVQVNDCGRLAALPYMLKRGRLRNAIGPDLADTLLGGAEIIPIAPQPTLNWLGPLVGVAGDRPWRSPTSCCIG